ncbi:alpha/beta fold hydrolase [Nocardioides sp. MAHUQ-72]|uniref:alpha/beta fold hydrolase n=1 Tax=unclassified Nocardioides TaxID=2615069 RepID=UPI00361CE4A4
MLERSPQMYSWLVEGAFAGPLADPRLSRRDRELATVAALAAMGGVEPQLRVHMYAALRQGVTPEELRAVCEHVSVYAGFPRALNALTEADAVLANHATRNPIPVRRLQLSDHATEVAEIGEKDGDAPAVVLVHALGLTWRMWEPVIHDLARGRRVLAYDIRGHGAATDAPPPANMDTLAGDLHELMRQVGLSNAHVVGLSYGGAIAQAFAVNHPDAVESLTLAATTDRPFDSFEARATAVEREGTAAQVGPSLTRWFSPAALAENAAGVRYARECVLRGDPTQVAAAWRAFLKLDTCDRLTRFRKPTLVLAGERDASTTPEVMLPIAENLPDATYVELPGAPHMPTLETPTLVVEALDHFLPGSSS